MDTNWRGFSDSRKLLTLFEERSPEEYGKQRKRGTRANPACAFSRGRLEMLRMLNSLWRNDEGQDIAEYAVMLAVILVIVVGTVRLIGSNANNVFSSVASSLQ